MTLQELYSIPHLKKEIAGYEEKIKELEEMAESTTAKITGMPRGGGTSDKVGECATAIAFYKDFLKQAIAKRITTEIEILRYVESINDAELRRIMFLRFIQQKTWQQVADEIGGNNTEDSVRKRCNRYVSKRETMSDMSDLQAV